MSNRAEESKRKIKDELEKLRYEYKVELPKKIAQAREHGDLKENADYHAARERQSFVQARISFLNQQLSQLDSMAQSAAEDKVGFGVKIKARDMDSDDMIEFTFVSPGEVNPSKGFISLNSPIGIAFNNKGVGEEAVANIPAGKKRYFIEQLIMPDGTILEAQKA